MCQTLYSIPGKVGANIPVFGFGLLFGLWAVAFALSFGWNLRRQGLNSELFLHVLTMAMVGAAIVLVPPYLMDGEGRVPIRGFGVMLLAALSAAITLAVHRARQMQIAPQCVYSLVWWLFIPGILGARLFYVVEYWPQFYRPSASGSFDHVETVKAVLNIAQGGLVVYGAAIGGFGGFVVFARRHKISPLVLADVIAPSLMLGQALGRIGCFLNGCCYGGPCAAPWAVTFPQGSPPYLRQVHEGIISTSAWRSLPVHPTQLYSALGALFICLFLVLLSSRRARRDGEVAVWLITIYPASRFIIECIRTDEPGALGTPLTIAQLISLVLLAVAACSWVFLLTGSGPASRSSRRHENSPSQVALLRR